MSLDTWFLFFIAYLIVTLSPGPNVLLVIKNAVRFGYKAAITTIISNLLCQMIIVILVALGAGTILEKSPLLFLTLKLIGGVYLIYLGISGFLKKEKIEDKSDIENSTKRLISNSKVFTEAFFVSASNPKTIIFLSAFLPQFISTDVAVNWQFIIMYSTICLIVLLVHLSYSYIAININEKWSGLKAKPIFTKITNSAFIAFGCGVIASSRRA